jgi:integrase
VINLLDYYARLYVFLILTAVTGKYIQHSETVVGTHPEAEKRLRQLLTDLDKGIFVRPGKATVGEYLVRWLSDYVKPNLSPSTHALYSIICTKHIIPTLGNVALAKLKPTQLQHLYAAKQEAGLSNRTVQLIHTTLHKALKNAVKAGLLSRNVAEAVDRPKITRHEMKVMNETDLHLFLEMAQNTEYYALFYTLLFTGMRRAEALALRWQDVDLLLCQISVNRSMQYLDNAPIEDRITFKQPKTEKSRRLIALSPSTAAVLREHREVQDKQRVAFKLSPVTDTDLVFSHWNGTPLLPNSVTHAWIKLTRRCGLDGIRLHDARHTHASLLLKQGVHPKIVQERLGHAGIAITLDLYSHVAPGLQQAAANRFDDLILSNANQQHQITI